jgi:hypothetical protein
MARLGTLCLLPLLWGLPAHAQELQVDLERPRSVRFLSRTTLEDFEGITESIDGFVLLPDGIQEGGSFPASRLYFEVDLGSIDTGIGLRNRHMRDNYLETDEYPFATFDAAIAKIELADGGHLVTARGTLAIHGIEREVTIRCSVAESTPPHRVICRFPVLLGDHGIRIPRVMFMKLAEEVVVEIDFFVREP